MANVDPERVYLVGHRYIVSCRVSLSYVASRSEVPQRLPR